MSHPKTTSYSDIDLNRWREYDHVWTDSLWLIGARDRTGGHKLDYHGNFIPQIATQVYFSRAIPPTPRRRPVCARYWR